MVSQTPPADVGHAPSRQLSTGWKAACPSVVVAAVHAAEHSESPAAHPSAQSKRPRQLYGPSTDSHAPKMHCWPDGHWLESAHCSQYE